jgi:hypothetical protein
MTDFNKQNYKNQQKRLYYESKEKGICVSEGCEKYKIEGYIHCQQHKDYFTNWKKNQNKQAKEKGICRYSTGCKELVVKGKSRCQKHLDVNKTIKNKYTNYKCNAKHRSIVFALTEEQFIFFWQQPCSYCGSKIETIGIDRFDNNKGYVEGNIISCCKWCNIMKMDHSAQEFLTHIRKIINNIKRSSYEKY